MAKQKRKKNTENDDSSVDSSAPSNKRKGVTAPNLPASRSGPQRSEPKSPSPTNSDIESANFESDSTPSNWDEESSRSSSSDGSQTTKPAEKPTQSTRIPPIFMKSATWRSVAPNIFNNSDIDHDGLSAQVTSDGKVQIKTRDVIQFRQIQKYLIASKIEFVSSKLPEDRQIKVVMRGVPMDVSLDELKSELEAQNFDVKMVKRFGSVAKPMPMCLVLLNNSPNAKDIYEVTDMFFVKIFVESFKKIGPAQCHACQQFGHSSHNCGNPPRCVKCAGEHITKECQKTMDQDPKCCNCNGIHTANFRGCPAYLSIVNAKPSQTQLNPQVSKKETSTPATNTQASKTTSSANSYANVTRGKPSLNIGQVITLLTDLLTAFTTTEDPKTAMITTIKSFLTLFSTQNEFY